MTRKAQQNSGLGKFKKVFIAGGTGLIGGNLAEYILGRFPKVNVQTTWQTTKPFIKHPRIRHIRADLRQRSECLKAVKGCDCAVIASGISLGAGANRNYRQVADNLAMDAFLLEACYEAGIRRIIFISSATVYQPFNGYITESQLEFDEDPHPSFMGFGWAKRSSEKLCQFWHDKYGQEIIILRCSNVFGPYAKFDPSNSNFIPALIRKAVAGMNPFKVWGRPEIVRDVIFVDDISSAITALIKASKIKFDIFNLGRGSTVTVGDVTRMILEAAGHAPAKVTFDRRSPVTMDFKALDCTKLSESIVWQPSVSVFDGIKRTVAWWRENKSWWKR